MSDDQPPQAADNSLSREEYDRLKQDPSFQHVLASIQRFDEYYDFSPAFLENFPNNLPRELPIKLGQRVIGSAAVDWKAVIATLFDWATTKPANLGSAGSRQISVVSANAAGIDASPNG